MPSSLSSAKPAEVNDLIQFVLSLSDSAAQAKVEHQRTDLVARRSEAALPDVISAALWQSALPTHIVVSPLWWRDYEEPDLHEKLRSNYFTSAHLKRLQGAPRTVMKPPRNWANSHRLRLQTGVFPPHHGPKTGMFTEFFAHKAVGNCGIAFASKLGWTSQHRGIKGG